LALEGVRGVFTAADISGSNQMGDIIKDELLFASKEVTAIYQPIAVVVAGMYQEQTRNQFLQLKISLKA
jgi:xanthine dehydrogenase molybdopterin-binding subunit B